MTAKELARQAKELERATEAWKQHIHDVRRKAGLAAQAKVGPAHTRAMRQRQTVKHLEQYTPHLVAEYEAAYAAADNGAAFAASENK